ncbi:hypothetical protein [Pseudomonas sp. CGJS7]|uniref:hypothetical protein n=1 Tax=Pseudomonas sp. CGJS7 TaxID=3109348 RepID=UPI00300A7D12
MTTDTGAKTQIVRAGMERISRDFTQGLADLGFARTRSKFWTRRFQHHLDFIHLHRSGSSYGASYNASVSLRVHLGIAVLDDDREIQALNGPDSDNLDLFRADRFHLRFNASSGSTYERCRDDLLRFVVQRAEPWFARWRTPLALLESEDSPLDADARQALRGGLDGHSAAERVARTLKRFGIED